MLHELLLSLSGHPTPLFSSPKTFPTTTPTEHALLTRLSHLSHLHSALRQHIPRIHSTHRSPICRAVATRIQRVQLRAFQQAILDAEADILSGDPSVVGAYDIVPLAGVVARFEGWRRRLEWMWGVVGFILPVEGEEGRDEAARGACNGARLMDKLREEAKTGYPDIAEMVQDLIQVAEGAWVRQLAGWLLQGRRATASTASASNDFFIQSRSYNPRGKSPKSRVATERLAVNYALLPEFVSQETAASVLYIGKTLNYLDGVDITDTKEASSAHTPSLQATPSTTHAHIQPLHTLQPPLTNTSLTDAIHRIRANLTTQLTHGGILPITHLLSTLHHLHHFFLGGHIDFHAQLIRHADAHLEARHAQTRTARGNESAAEGLADHLAAVMMTEAEPAAVLARTFVALSAGDGGDEVVEWGRQNLVLRLERGSAHTSGRGDRDDDDEDDDDEDDDDEDEDQGSNTTPTHFNDFLLPTPTTLTLPLKPPLDLFLTASTMTSYTTINDHILALRRAHTHLTHLWHPSTLRRPRGPHPENKRSAKTRKPFTTAAHAVFLLAQLGDHITARTIEPSWARFRDWVDGRAGDRKGATEPQRASGATTRNKIEGGVPQSDPTAVTHAHALYLAQLTTCLYLRDARYTHALRELLMAASGLCGLMRRLAGLLALGGSGGSAGTANAHSTANAHEHCAIRSRRGATCTTNWGVRLDGWTRGSKGL